MALTGVVRRVDDLGRVTSPKEMRRALGIEIGDLVEISIAGDGILMKKYSDLSNVQSYISRIVEILNQEYLETDPGKCERLTGMLKQLMGEINCQEEQTIV